MTCVRKKKNAEIIVSSNTHLEELAPSTVDFYYSKREGEYGDFNGGKARKVTPGGARYCNFIG